jgi:hypothetical protein
VAHFYPPLEYSLITSPAATAHWSPVLQRVRALLTGRTPGQPAEPHTNEAGHHTRDDEPGRRLPVKRRTSGPRCSGTIFGSSGSGGASTASAAIAATS